MSQVPDSIAKRDIFFGARKISDTDALRYAKNYEQEGFESDALDFFSLARSTDDMRRMAQRFCQEGDTFLFLKAQRLLGDSALSDIELRHCAEEAEKRAKIRYAIMGFEKLGDEKKVASLRELIKEDGDQKALAEADVFIAANLEEIQDSAEEE